MWFLLIPPVAVLLAIAWTALRSRPDRSYEAMITIAGYRRSMAALARPIPDQSGPRSGFDLDDSGYPEPTPFDDPHGPYGLYAPGDPFALNQRAGDQSGDGQSHSHGHDPEAVPAEPMVDTVPLPFRPPRPGDDLL
ncbi:hypothetical protein [Frankia sp. AgB32]|uniref:hypothetical protein n=1 Tax=Frankia sp. AgB32 TaxID=631119 RepID=UPI00200D7EF9|nr:hypothetical protein [Frankia sp. AgB32]MCK9897431.1 hypothetical protein [Frankia sp. AgB32]